MNRRGFLKSSGVAAATALAPASLRPDAQERGIVRYPDPWVEVIDDGFQKTWSG